MIQIQRTSAPSVLRTSRAQKRYRDPLVVDALHLMQHGKCCYCEEYIPRKNSGKHVEHFRPQSLFSNLKNDWNNLLLACATCNSYKSNSFPIRCGGSPVLLDPSDPDVDPEQHIEFIVSEDQSDIGRTGMAVSRGGSDQGRISIDTLGLYDEHHIKKRAEFVDTLENAFFELIIELKNDRDGHGDPHRIDALRHRLHERMRDCRRYAGVARCFFRLWRLEHYGVGRADGEQAVTGC